MADPISKPIDIPADNPTSKGGSFKSSGKGFFASLLKGLVEFLKTTYRIPLLTFYGLSYLGAKVVDAAFTGFRSRGGEIQANHHSKTALDVADFFKGKFLDLGKKTFFSPWLHWGGAVAGAANQATKGAFEDGPIESYHDIKEPHLSEFTHPHGLSSPSATPISVGGHSRTP
jgi:hypothetical protein